MTGLWITAGFVVAACIGVPICFAFMDRHQESAWRREAGQAAPERGRHRAPKAAAIPRAPTRHDPPWQPAPVPVIEPAAITHGPPEPEPDAYWIGFGTVSDDGRVRVEHMVLSPPVEALLGHASTGDAVESMSAGWHSVESLFTKAMTRQVRALTDGAS